MVCQSLKTGNYNCRWLGILIVVNQGKEPYEKFTGKAKRKDGSWFDIEASSSPIISGGKVIGSRDIVRDISDRKALEKRLAQMQKMEAVSQLAGGIAHEFNNILTVIMGCANLIKLDLPETDPNLSTVLTILSATNQAAELTRNLLAFSKKQDVRLELVDLNEVIKDITTLIKSAVGEAINLRIDLAAQKLNVLADANQIEQVLLNIAVNARDAMTAGGLLRIDTQLRDKDAVITVADTGQGMNEEVIPKIFEPFFTTKEIGKGKGLGLSVAYGIMEQHNGSIHIDSNARTGTRVEVLLPLAGGPQIILVAEDDEPVRDLLHRILSDAGYLPEMAVDGNDAVDKYQARNGNIDLLVLDIIMPGRNGIDVYKSIRSQDPGVPAIFLSGYTKALIEERGILDDGIEFLQKPISSKQLLAAIRNKLGTAPKG